MLITGEQSLPIHGRLIVIAIVQQKDVGQIFLTILVLSFGHLIKSAVELVLKILIDLLINFVAYLIAGVLNVLLLRAFYLKFYCQFFPEIVCL